MNQFSRNLILWAVISLLMVVLFNMFSQPQNSQTKVSYTKFLELVDKGDIAEVSIQGQKLLAKEHGGTVVNTYAPDDPKLVDRLVGKGIVVNAEPKEDSPWYMTLLVSWFPMLLLIGVWIFFMRQMQGGGGKAMSFGRSRARLISQDQSKVTFADVAGIDEAKEELSEVVDFLSNPKRFTRLGGRIPKGVLLVGPPGTGKTLLARAVAGEAGVPFFSISGSDFVEMFVGVGASRVRDLFVQGKKNAPCLIFIDEIDAVGRQRGAGLGGGHDEREQTLNQLLVEMDGFESNEGVILIAATNRPDVLDPALLRPGRFDRQVTVPVPDVRGRKRILEVHARRSPLAGDVNMEVIAKGTPGFSGADLENLVNEAALQAAKENKDQINMFDFEQAKDKLIMGKERRSMVMSEDEKKITAYHEGGHALCAKLLPKADPVHKVSIIPRGRALGVTMQLPGEDRYGYSRSFLETNLVVLLAGRVAEEIIFNDITTGAGNDIERATKMARKMVCEWGMSEAIGPLNIGEQGEEVFIGREWNQSRNYSDETARLVDAEVKRMVESARSAARELIEGNMELLEKIAASLLERETITGADIDLLIEGKELPPLEDMNGKDAAPAENPADAPDAFAKAAAAYREQQPESAEDSEDFILGTEEKGQEQTAPTPEPEEKKAPETTSESSEEKK
ncbi:ATP-dependent zinc metalloprotease FtsH [Halodesulfovibrio sp. MK-HDV]|uniref:ATP-dependent zinc metalloprotease FtsH n=1 Tax=unclassified Halodesulfovibrio TaxID=2644657 RepID=UPI001369BD26|nr:ATP-dependent zinc metalloprotease FtsH [Halodesulfovibrio sp. MK-HDV]KAF1075491.1 ATP-dependent zinc metalloprotease FtsH [Halodesulfovibrio sp. MK-HDV]